MIKAILFDFDGVLTTAKTGSETIIEYIARKTGIEEGFIKAEYYKYNRELLYGKLVHKDIWWRVCEGLGQEIPMSILTEAFRNTPVDKEMLSLVAELKKSCKIGMITDNKQDRMNEILDWFDMRRLFDVVSVSAQYQSGKGERLIFEKTIEALQVRPEECIFIDNSMQNLVVPEEMGMKVIYYDTDGRNIAGLKEELDELLQENR